MIPSLYFKGKEGEGCAAVRHGGQKRVEMVGVETHLDVFKDDRYILMKT
jgi:hypothetical protein